MPRAAAFIQRITASCLLLRDAAAVTRRPSPPPLPSTSFLHAVQNGESTSERYAMTTIYVFSELLRAFGTFS